MITYKGTSAARHSRHSIQTDHCLKESKTRDLHISTSDATSANIKVAEATKREEQTLHKNLRPSQTQAEEVDSGLGMRKENMSSLIRGASS